MTTRVFQLLTEGIRDGKQAIASAAVYPGELVKFDSAGSSVGLGDASTAYGFAFGGRYQAYRPTTEQFQVGEPLTVVWGAGEALMSEALFTSGSLPSAGTLLYAAANGLWATTGSVKVAQCQQIVARTEPVGGVGQSQALAHVRFNIVP